MTPKLKSLAILSVHTCPYAALGGKKTGGMNVYIRELARHLGNRGIKVDIFTRCESKTAPVHRHLGANVNVIHIPSGPPKTLDPINIYPHLDEFTSNLLAYQKKHEVSYDLIHSHYWLSGLVALKLKEAWKAPVLQTFHTLARVKEQFMPGTSEPTARHQAEQLLVKEADHILGFTPDDAGFLASLYAADPAKITLIPPGVDTNLFTPIPRAQAKAKIGLPQDKQLLLFVGRLDPIKGLETLLKALALVEKQCDCNNLSLAIIGGNEQDVHIDKIKSLAHQLGIAHIATFLGSRQQHILPYYYSAADATVIPSSHESFGLVALESMACATPVIASRVGGLKYLVKDNVSGLLIPADQPQQLASAIKKLFLDKNLRLKLGKSAMISAQTYSWQIITPLVLSLYQKLLS